MKRKASGQLRRGNTKKRRMYKRSNTRRNFTNPNLQNLTSNVTLSRNRVTPFTKKVTLKYGALKTQSNQLSSTVRFNCNGLYDPDSTGVGHQPMGFDQYMAFYSKYVVHGCKIEVSANSMIPTQRAFYSLRAVPSGAGFLTNIESIIEAPNSVYGYIGPSEGPSGRLKLSSYMNISKYFSEPLIESKYEGTASQNPLQLALWDLTAVDINGTGVEINALIEITYYCTLKEPIDLIAS